MIKSISGNGGTECTVDTVELWSALNLLRKYAHEQAIRKDLEGTEFEFHYTNSIEAFKACQHIERFISPTGETLTKSLAG